GVGAAAGALLDVARQVVQLAGFLPCEHAPHFAAGGVELSGLDQREDQIVAVRVVVRIDRPRPLQVRNGGLQLPLRNQERRKGAVRLKTVGTGADGVGETSFNRRPIWRDVALRGSFGWRQRKKTQGNNRRDQLFSTRAEASSLRAPTCFSERRRTRP